MLKILWIFLLCLFSSVTFAGTKAFGVEINESTEAQILTTYPKAVYQGINQYSKGKMYKIPKDYFAINGLQEVVIILNINKKVVGVLSTFNKANFDDLYNSLNKKYSLVSKTIPYVGNKYVHYRDGKTNIYLDAPHMSFSLNLNYLDNVFENQYKQDQFKQKQEEEKRKESFL